MASRSCRGSGGDVVRGVAGAGLSTSGGARCRRHAAASACIRCMCPTGECPARTTTDKLDWLAALADHLPQVRRRVVCGDMNIAPADEDVFDPDAYVGQTHAGAGAGGAGAAAGAGLRDVVRDRWPGKRVSTYWDYRAGMFHQDLGMRIDLVLASAPVAERVRGVVDRHARGSGPSDHAPGDRGPGRGSRRRYRPGGPAAVRAGHSACEIAADPWTLRSRRTRTSRKPELKAKRSFSPT